MTLEQTALEHSKFQALISEFKRIANDNPSPLQLAQKRILELEQVRDSAYAEVNEWIENFQEYFPGARGFHDVFRGIEALEVKLAKLEAREKWMNERVYYAEWTDSEGKTAQFQPKDDGFYDKNTHIEHFSFTQLVDQVMK